MTSRITCTLVVLTFNTLIAQVLRIFVLPPLNREILHLAILPQLLIKMPRPLQEISILNLVTRKIDPVIGSPCLNPP
jgi:hypothetical protein